MLKIIGLGNLLRGDDSVGPVIIQKLQKLTLSIPMELYEVGMDALAILEHLIGSEPILIIDCAKMGKKPGEIAKFHITECNISSINKSISLHGLGFGEIYQIAQTLGEVTECKIIGVEPKQLDYNSGLSEEVENNLPKIIEMIIREAKYYAQKDFNN